MMSQEHLVRTLHPWLGSVSTDGGVPPTDPAQSSASQVGHASLGPATFDADTGGLPPASIHRDGDILAFFSGFLLNRDDVCRALKGPDLDHTASDAEVVSRAYVGRGLDSPLELQGSFAAAIWDQKRHRLLLFRDSGGLHPLFYWHRNRRLLFSWSVHKILAQPGVSKSLNRVVLAEHLVSRWIDPEETFWEGISRLPAGHALELNNGHPRIFRYWDPLPEGGSIQWASEEETREFPQRLQKAVERTLRFGQTGVLLSGGFDSVSVAACARDWAHRTGGPPPKAYSLRFAGDDDESPIQTSVARRLGLTQHLDEVSTYEQDPGLVAGCITLSGDLPSPPIDVLKPAYLGLLSIACGHGCKVALTGEGGDEWLAVSPAHLADLIARGQFLRVASLVRTFFKFWTLPVLPGLRNTIWSNGFRLLLRERIRRWMPGVARARRRQLLPTGMPAWLAPDPELRRILSRRFLERWKTEFGSGSHYIQDMRRSLRHLLLEMAAEERFFRDQRAGLPTLHPYLDRDLVEFLLRVPPDLLIRGGQSKALVREMMEQRFPELGFAKQKKVLATSSFLRLFGKEVPPVWRQLESFRALEDLGIVNKDHIREAMTRWISSDTVLVRGRSFVLVSAEAWTRSQL